MSRLACPLVCVFYSVVVKCFTPKYPQKSVRNLITNCGPLSVRKYVRMTNGMIRWSMKMFAMCVDNVLDMRIARASLEYRSVIMHMNRLPLFVSSTGLSMSIAVKSRGPDAGKSCMSCLWRYQISFGSQRLLLATVV